MAKIVLISCASKKLPHESRARDLYASPLFRKNLQYAESLEPDNIFILSAKYGVVKLDQKIQPYNETLNNMNSGKRKQWANQVLHSLEDLTDLERDDFVFLAGKNYREHIIPSINHYEIPMKGLEIGRQLQWLTGKISSPSD